MCFLAPKREMIQMRSYAVRGMDCAAEVEALKATVGRLPAVERLDFNLLTATMTVTAAETLSDEEVREAARRAGLDAAPTTARPPPEDAAGFWHDRFETCCRTWNCA